MFDKPYPDGGKLGGGGIGEYELQQELPQSALLLLPLFAGEKTVCPSALACTVNKELFPQPTAQEGTVKIDFSHSVVQECTVKKKLSSRVQLEHALLKKGFSPNVQALACTVKKEVFLFQCTALECTVKKKRFPPAYKL